eukprot:1140123-Pelagomonas_calceolata.AAC.6
MRHETEARLAGLPAGCFGLQGRQLQACTHGWTQQCNVSLAEREWVRRQWRCVTAPRLAAGHLQLIVTSLS